MKHRGFTLLEFMIIIVIILILGSTALPNYIGYMKRAKVAEAFMFSSHITKLVANYYAYHGTLPPNNQALLLPMAEQLSGHYIATLQVETGAIHLTFQDEGLTGILTLQPSTVSTYPPLATLIWRCGYAQPAVGTTVFGDNKTTIAPEFLPDICQRAI